LRSDAVREVVRHLLDAAAIVSSIAQRIELVILSAYSSALPLMWRAARPMVWISERSERRKLPCRHQGSPPATLREYPAPRAAG